MFVSLYRKYRPTAFDSMYGQEHIKTVLKRQCETGKVSHAYLFCGTRGTGKTTSAKILAKAVNCLAPNGGEPCGKCASCLSIDAGTATDVLELDAASNNGVDDIRDICEQVIYPPATLKYRVYIIDEVHMLSAGAYNALLKTLEEPPAHVIFILATTELQKIPPTILSRCQRFEFRRIMPEDIRDCLLSVAEKEGLKLEHDAAELLAELADGAMRDGLSLLESCASACGDGCIDAQTVRRQLGMAQDGTVYGILSAVLAHDAAAAVNLLEEYYNSAKSLAVLIENLVGAIRDVLVFSQPGMKPGSLSRLTAEEIAELSRTAPAADLLYMADVLEETQTRLSRYPFNKRMLCEMALIRLCDSRLSVSPQALLARITALETGLARPERQPSSHAEAAPVVKEVQKPSRAEAAPKAEPQSAAAEDERAAAVRTAKSESGFDYYEKTPELVEALRAVGSDCAMVSQARLLVRGSTLNIVASPFIIAILSEARAVTDLKKALYSIDGREYDIIFTDETKVSSDDKNLIDEI